MALNPLKVFLFVVGGTVAAAATAFYAGAWRDGADAPRQAALSGDAVKAPAETQTAAGKQEKPEQQASAGQAMAPADAPAPATADAPGVAATAPANTVDAPGAVNSSTTAETSAVAAANTGEQVSSAQKPATADSATPAAVPNAPVLPETAAASAESGDAPASLVPTSESAGTVTSKPEPATPLEGQEAALQPQSEPAPAAAQADVAEPVAGGEGAGTVPSSDDTSAAGATTGGPAPAAPVESRQAALEPQPESAPSTSRADVAGGGGAGAVPSANGASVEGAPDQAAPAAAGAADPDVPTFDVVRVEPDGSTVVAGRAGADAKVDLMLGGKVLASTTAGTEGDFAIVLDEPLKPGDHQIQLKGTAPGGGSETSKQTALVSVPEGGKGQVLAMVEEPGAPSKVLTASEPAPSQEASVSEPAVGGAGAEALDAVQRETGSEPTRQAALAPADEMAGPPTAPTGSAQQAPVSVQAVEIEGRKIYVAGLAAPGAAVRVYADDALLGDARASGTGEFLVETTRDLAVGTHTIRADQLKSDGSVLARAAVPFEREPGENVAAVAPALDISQPEASTASAVRTKPSGSVVSAKGAEGLGEVAEAPSAVTPQTVAPMQAEPGSADLAAEGGADAAAAPGADHVPDPAQGGDSPQSAPAASAAIASETSTAKGAGAVTTGLPTSQQGGSETEQQNLDPSVAVAATPETGSATQPSAETLPAAGGQAASGDASARPEQTAQNGGAKAPSTDGSTPNGATSVAMPSAPNEGSSVATPAPATSATTPEVRASEPAEAAAAEPPSVAIDGDMDQSAPPDAASAAGGAETVAPGSTGAAVAANPLEAAPSVAAEASAASEEATDSAQGSGDAETPAPSSAEVAVAAPPAEPAPSGTAETGMEPGTFSGAGEAVAPGASSATAKGGNQSQTSVTSGTDSGSASTQEAPGTSAGSAVAVDQATGMQSGVPTGSPETTAQQADQEGPAAVRFGSPPVDGVAVSPTGAGEEIAAAGGGADMATGPKLHNVQGAVIIRRGDSLWRISRRVYGYGTRYSTIYLANTDQIRNPDLIMPGQVFTVPTRSQQGEAADLDALGDQKASRVE